jgi:uncharacterized membrane protein YeaQ/YmgE (transglycosylase-associated protein family)
MIGAMDFFSSIDVIVSLAVGAIIGALAGQVMRGGGLGLIGNLVIGIVGAVLSGYLFDWANVIDLGDLLDPIFAGAVGAVVLLAIAGLIRR